MTDQQVGHSGHKPSSLKTAAERAEERKLKYKEEDAERLEAARAFREANKIGEYAEEQRDGRYSLSQIADTVEVEVQETTDGGRQFVVTLGPNQDVELTIPWGGEVKSPSVEPEPEVETPPPPAEDDELGESTDDGSDSGTTTSNPPSETGTSDENKTN